ncbi:MAG: lytic transglycosylase domain-containing protein [Thiomargarita sp.]|nr:lytic transglycosylase domain-containing protein [Thiomargarita sp.]
MKKIIFISGFSIALLLLASKLVATEIYSYIDNDGVLQISNKMPVTSKHITVKIFPEANVNSQQTMGIYNCLDTRNGCSSHRKTIKRLVTPVTYLLKPNKVSSTTEAANNISRKKTIIYKCITNSKVIYTDNPISYTNCRVIRQKRNIPTFSIDSNSAKVSIHKKYEKYKNLVAEVAAEINLEAALLHAVIHTESSYNPNAVSPKGAVGLMQLMPATAKRFGVADRNDAVDNVYGGARYLHHLLDLFDQNLKLALASYNAGENAVMRYGNKIPPYRETKNYVKKVIKLYQAYQYY